MAVDEEKEREARLPTVDINDAHTQYGHVSEEVLRRTLKQQGFKPTGTLQPCPACLIHKGRQKAVPKHTKTVATRPGERLHIDSQGLTAKSHKGDRHWIKIKDQYSGMSWNAFVKYKSETPVTVENKLIYLRGLGIKVSYLRCDNAGEHLEELQWLCNHFGITMEYTASNTPQQNGLVERQLATELRRANSMMEAAGLTPTVCNLLRPEALTTACILDNTLCDETGKSKYEKFYGHPPKLTMKHMIEFGRIGYVTDRKQFKQKHKARANPFVMVGYALNHSIDTYRMYNPKTRKVVITRDVRWGPATPVTDPRAKMGVHTPTQLESWRKVHERQPDQKTTTPTKTLNLDPILDHYTASRKISPQSDIKEDEKWMDGTHAGRVSTSPSRRRISNKKKPVKLIKNLKPAPTPQKDKRTWTSPVRRLKKFKPTEEDEEDKEDEEKMFSDIEDDDDEEDEEEELEVLPPQNHDFYDRLRAEIEEDANQTREPDPGNRLQNELRGLGLEPAASIPWAVRQLHTDYNPVLDNVYSAITSDPGEPTSIKEALAGPEKMKWREAIKKEIDNFIGRKVWKKVSREQVTHRDKRKLISTKWVFKKKVEQDNSIRYKARCVSRGFMQIPGVDYTESFAPVATDTSIRLTVGIYLYYDDLYPQEQWMLEMFDVEAAFLNAELTHPQYIEWPQGMFELGYITQEDMRKFCIELQKAMYGNIDSPLRWMKTFAAYLINVLGLKQAKTDPCIFYKTDKGRLVLLLVLYVDDTLCVGRRTEMIWMYQMIERKFNIERLGQLKKHLGVWWTWKKDLKGKKYLVANMPKMIEEIGAKYLEATGKVAKSAPTPGYPGKVLKKHQGQPEKLDAYRSIVGKIMYYATKIAPEVSNAVRELASHLTNPSEDHWKALERCVGYITSNHFEGLIFRKPRQLKSISYCDSDYAKDEDDRKSISGRINTVGGMVTNWTSKKQGTVSLSSTEAEYQSLSECALESMFTQNLIKEVTGVFESAIVYEDNLGAIYLMKNSQISQRTKHIDIRHHYLRDLMDEGRLDVRFVRSEDNPSDIATKNTDIKTHEKHAADVRNGTMKCQMEDVKADQSVRMYEKGMSQQREL